MQWLEVLTQHSSLTHSLAYRITRHLTHSLIHLSPNSYPPPKHDQDMSDLVASLISFCQHISQAKQKNRCLSDLNNTRTTDYMW